MTSIHDEMHDDAVSPSNKNTVDELNAAEHENSRLRAAVVCEIIEREGAGELARGFPALWWSGVAAGLAIGFSVLSEALLATYLPGGDYKPLVENLGYPVGFIIVILARQQLFTENTLTAVLPVIKRKQFVWLSALLRLWAIVLVANLVGCSLFAWFLTWPGVIGNDVAAQVAAIATHLMQNSPWEMFARAIAAGWLIAALVWMIPSAEGNELLVITLITYIIALADFTHVIAGASEVIYLVITGSVGLGEAAFGFFLPTLLGNVIGGTVLFGVLSYAQVREELPQSDSA